MSIRHALAPVAALLIGVSILLTGQGLQGTLLPVRASLEGFSTLLIGVIGGAYFLGFTFGCLKGGELVKRVGHIRVFAAMTALASAVPLAHGLIVTPWIWGLLRLVSGFCFAVLYVVIESWLNEQSDNESRGTVFSIYAMITLTVMGLGQMMILLRSPEEMYLFAIASVLVSLAAIPVVLSVSQSPQQPQSVDVNLRRLFQISPTGTLGCLAAGCTNGAFWSLAPVFTAALSDDISLAAWFMTSALIGGALAQWPLGMLSDAIGRRKLLAAAALVGVGVAIFIVIAVDNFSFLGISLLGAAWGAIAFPLYAVSVAHANDHANPDEYVMVSSGLLLMYGSGAIVGPFVASTLMTLTDATGLYVFSATIHALLVLYAVYRIFRRESAPSEQHIAFVDALATAQTASQVYEEEIQFQADDDE